MPTTSQGRVVFVNTKFSCLATFDDRDNFAPLWRPPFISKLTPEDRCHLNGLALEAGQARYVTACGTSHASEAWRNRRHDGGVMVQDKAHYFPRAGDLAIHASGWTAAQSSIGSLSGRARRTGRVSRASRGVSASPYWSVQKTFPEARFPWHRMPRSARVVAREFLFASS